MALAPRLRDDIIVRPSLEDPDIFYVKDPLVDRYFELNALQYEIVRRLDGKHTPAALADEISKAFDVEVVPDDVDGFLSELHKMQLFDLAGDQIRGPEFCRLVGGIARKQLKEEGFDLSPPRPPADGQPEDPRRRNRRERALFDKGIGALVEDRITDALGYFSAILECNPQNRRAEVFRKVLQNAIITTRARLASPSEKEKADRGGLRFRLFNPSRLLELVDHLVGRYVFTRYFLAFSILLSLAALGVMLANSAELAQSVQSTSIATTVWILYCYYVVRLVLHELGHGLACKHYGGRVLEIGLGLFYFLMPTAFCDVSDSYFFTRRQRVVTLLAGVVMDVLTWSLVVIGWRMSEAGTAPHMVFSVIISVGLFVCISSLIPFVMKSDGYYILCIVFNVPNLHNQAAMYFRSIMLSLVSGNDVRAEIEPSLRPFALLFQITAMACRLFVSTLLSYIVGSYVISKLGGPGVVVTLVVVAGFIYTRFSKFFRALPAAIRVNPKRFWRPWRVLILAGLVAAPVVVPLLIPWRLKVTVPVALRGAHRAEIRANVAGRVKRVLVREGQAVVEGQLVAQLDTTVLVNRLRRIAAAQEVVDKQLEVLRGGRRPQELAVLQRTVERLETEVRFEQLRWQRAHRLSHRNAAQKAEEEEARHRLAARKDARDAALAAQRRARARALPESIAALTADRARLDAEERVVRLELVRSDIRAPFAGVVVTPRVQDQEGIHLHSGEELCEIVDLRSMRAVADLPRQADVAIGAVMRVKLRSDARPTHVCRVSRISAQATGGGTFEAECALGDVTGVRFGVGMTGRAEILSDRRSLMYYLLRPLTRLINVEVWSLW